MPTYHAGRSSPGTRPMRPRRARSRIATRRQHQSAMPATKQGHVSQRPSWGMNSPATKRGDVPRRSQGNLPQPDANTAGTQTQAVRSESAEPDVGSQNRFGPDGGQLVHDLVDTAARHQ